MTARTLTVVSGGLRQPSSTRLLADRLAEATARELQLAGDDPRIEVVELRDHAHDIIDNLLTGFPNAALREVTDRIARADGVIAVSPIFNASYSGLFKSFFDVLEDDSLDGTPVLIGATGGTARHSLALEHALRPMFAHLRAVVVPTAVYAATEDFADPRLAARIDRAAAELAHQVHARPTIDRPDPFTNPTPFTQLLTGTP